MSRARRGWLSSAIRAGVDLFYPRECPGCRTVLPPEEDGLICPACLEGLPGISGPLCLVCGEPLGADGEERCSRCLDGRSFDSARAAFLYGPGPATELILALKHGGWPELGGPLGRIMAERMAERPEEDRPELVTPVPLHRWRRISRGHDQAHLLARSVGRALGIPCHRLLRRVRRTPPQDGGRDLRRENVSGAFRARDEALLEGRRVLLVDDVMTTGATIEECARTLREAGAVRVDVLTLARAALD